MGFFSRNTEEEPKKPKFEYFLGEGGTKATGKRLIIRFGNQDVIIRACEGFKIEASIYDRGYGYGAAAVLFYEVYDSDLFKPVYSFKPDPNTPILAGETTTFSQFDSENDEILNMIEIEAIKQGAKVLQKRRIG